MTFREATPADIPALSEIRLSVRENALSNPGRITREMYEEHLTRIGKGWLCEIDGEIVGFAVASSRDRSIWALFMKQGYEGRGIGRALLGLAVEWLFAGGVETIHLTTAPGTRADRLYRHLGWTRGGLTEDGEVRYSLPRCSRRRP